MDIYGGGNKILQRSDVPQWNLLTGTSQELQTITIPKGNFYPGNYQHGEYQKEKLADGVSTYSAYIVNKSTKYSIMAELDAYSAPSNPAFSNAIAPKSEGRIVCTRSDLTGIYFRTDTGTDKKAVDEDVVFQIKEEKLEHGSIATNWLPAISDLTLKNQSK